MADLMVCDKCNGAGTVVEGAGLHGLTGAAWKLAIEGNIARAFERINKLEAAAEAPKTATEAEAMVCNCQNLGSGQMWPMRIDRCGSITDFHCFTCGRRIATSKSHE